MKQIAKLLNAFFIAVLISGCSSKYSLFSCKTPDVKEVKVDNSHRSTLLGESKKCYKNYLLIKEENEKLRKANEVCK